ncbi:hypothetical protein [Croceicoccus sp. Ery15]|uniref:hypothetical protein n=1 Tax=Croceicoccus sp. Ery15 TaxID=1703338 RepID=UPI001E2DE2C2|nr:hypothetical protein [Croceicoccus sp. Ery15]
MARDCEISQAVKCAQETIFRVACKTRSLKAISLDSGIPYSTLRTYAGENGATAEMPVSAVRKLTDIIPDELLSLLLNDGRQIVKAPEGIDFDELADHMRDWLREKDHAHHADSPGGREIAPCEKEKLSARLAVVRAA